MTNRREDSTWYQERELESRRLTDNRKQVNGYEVYDAIQTVALSAYIFEKKTGDLVPTRDNAVASTRQYKSLQLLPR